MKDTGFTTLTPAQFEEMGRAWPGKRGLLSPLEVYAAQGGAKTVRVNESLGGALAVLAAPAAVTEMVFARDGSPQTCVVYRAGAGSASGMMLDDNDQVTLCPAQAVNALVSEFVKTLGQDGLENAAFSAALTVKEAWVLGLLLDLQRQAALRTAVQSASRQMDLPPVVCPANTVWQVLSAIADPQNSQQALAVLADEPGWATLFCLCSELQPTAVNEVEVGHILTGLAERGLAAKGSGGFSLAERPAQFANHFLIPSRTIFLKVVRENNGQLEEEQLTCQQDGKAFLYIFSDPEAADKTWMMGGSYEMLARAATMALEKPGSLYTLLGIEKVVDEEPPNGLTCSVCGSLLAAGARFCKMCGTPVGQKPAAPVYAGRATTCPKCGSPVDLGAKFCKICGSKLQAFG